MRVNWSIGQLSRRSQVLVSRYRKSSGFGRDFTRLIRKLVRQAVSSFRVPTVGCCSDAKGVAYFFPKDTTPSTRQRDRR
jgi:hypothetical protein